MRLLIIALCVFLAAPAIAADLNLAWDASTGATGYKVQISTDQGATWGEARDTGNATTFTWTGAPDTGLTLFRVSAYNGQGETINYTKGAWHNGSWTVPAAATALGLK